MKKIKSQLNNGSALLIVIIIVMTVSVAAPSMSTMILAEYRMSRASRDSLQAYYGAESATEVGLALAKLGAIGALPSPEIQFHGSGEISGMTTKFQVSSGPSSTIIRVTGKSTVNSSKTERTLEFERDTTAF
ncbi:hypothetical protein AUK11_01410 [bacterium CG2_30_37_16]|nr:MAG: hypothetical protein AUK11_01410 [bacterium CG2_30_37_16]PIP31268.1 MAG: hypothetical protein COX25_00215 [bacterium (Candidatus Howlettbacteria) CG23_combo_of_CG06-09_8_20_14_all_37_9]PIY00461.1 MAG: hypothetical protein COZ22_00190 [bacterium (Candidatus Howlettbacteria) CG_4_10_14_3_um_filter_37_10]PJB05696.1 MAG: hypothetical protein CO123_03610 [bacterium (Candidatus Howlettbacteria) CG_4_9_14_3_um_filter_37_10]